MKRKLPTSEQLAHKDGQELANQFRKPFAVFKEAGIWNTIQVGLKPHPDTATIYHPE